MATINVEDGTEVLSRLVGISNLISVDADKAVRNLDELIEAYRQIYFEKEAIV